MKRSSGSPFCHLGTDPGPSLFCPQPEEFFLSLLEYMFIDFRERGRDRERERERERESERERDCCKKEICLWRARECNQYKNQKLIWL